MNPLGLAPLFSRRTPLRLGLNRPRKKGRIFYPRTRGRLPFFLPHVWVPNKRVFPNSHSRSGCPVFDYSLFPLTTRKPPVGKSWRFSVEKDMPTFPPFLRTGKANFLSDVFPKYPTILGSPPPSHSIKEPLPRGGSFPLFGAPTPSFQRGSVFSCPKGRFPLLNC